MCLQDNAEICTMRSGRGCIPALINMDYELLTEEEKDQINTLSDLEKDLKKVSKEVESMASGFKRTIDKINNSRRIR